MADPARFFVAAPLALGTPVALGADESHHALRVLRLRDGEDVVVFNGQDAAYVGRLVLREGHTQAQVVPREAVAALTELPYAVTIAQGLCASEKMDWLVEKAVELGALHLIPLALERCVVKLNGDRAQRRVAHWQQLAIAAAKQSGRNRLLDIVPPLMLSAWLARPATGALKLVLDPRATTPLAALARTQAPAPVQLAIGPEGGFAEHEMRQLADAGFRSVSLGPRVLRTETAALVAMATLAAHWT